MSLCVRDCTLLTLPPGWIRAVAGKGKCVQLGGQ
ncbi:MAG: hypothetical protein FNNCIFGK_00313 [Bacteroidia bacterium]|nr:hypothetical protein [Bacteroidia bacterium]